MSAMLKVGVFQCEGGGLSGAQRLKKLADVAGSADLDLIVCPELFLSGYNVGADVHRMAEPVDGPFAQQVGEIARTHTVAVAYGYPERHDGEVYNSAACISSDGVLLANHRKLMIPPGFEEEYFGHGDKVTVFDLGGVRCGLLVCFDAEFPEAVRVTAQAGAQIVIVPTALGKDWPVVANRVIPARAFESGVWLVYANHAGEENGARFLGRSCIVSPEGKDAVRAGTQEQFIYCDIDLTRVDKAQKRLPFLPLSTVLANRLNG